MHPAHDRRRFLAQSATAVVAAATVAACGGGDAPGIPAKFAYGVASGDPLSDRVILWTHARRPDDTSAVALTWQIASDSYFSNVLVSGKASATSATGFTVKVDATGLQPGTSYFYRFFDEAGSVSPTGTTRTLPAASVASVKFAVFSCSLYSEGFFNAYADAAKSDAQFALHLGDYIYEYGADPKKYGNTDAVTLGRVTSPANDIVSLDDYRTRYAVYRGDPDLQALHAKMPMICIWDDHEFANNAYVSGAENHNPATQGDWTTRKKNAAQVYHEWMPIRAVDPANPLKIYRRFEFGSLLSLHMIDTRIEGRDQQYDNFGDADGGIKRYLTALQTGTDATHRMMSQEQQDWLLNGMKASAATWQVVGNQDIMARMWFPYSVVAAAPAEQPKAIQDFLTAKATRAAAGDAALSATQKALLSTTTNPRLPYNLDSWDGYPLNRDAILTAAKAANKNLVVLSGDSHDGWFANLTTLSGARAGWEFAGTSVTSTGFESVGLASVGPAIDGTALGAQYAGLGLGLIDDVGYADTSGRGYLMLTVSAASVKGEYLYVSTVKSKTFTTKVGRTITINAADGKVAFA